MWERFEQRKTRGEEGFLVTVVLTHSASPPYLSFNKSVRDQVIVKHRYCDIFIDRAGKRLGVRFLRDRSDINSYQVNQFGSRGRKNVCARLTLQKAMKIWGLWEKRVQPSFTRELKNDPAENMWWFDIAPLFGSNGSMARSSDRPIPNGDKP